MSPILWWKGICRTKELIKIAVAVLQLPPTTAATERSFSTHGWIHNAKKKQVDSGKK